MSNKSAQWLEQSSYFGSFPTSNFLVKLSSCGFISLGTTQLLTFGMPGTFSKHQCQIILSLMRLQEFPPVLMGFWMFSATAGRFFVKNKC